MSKPRCGCAMDRGSYIDGHQVFFCQQCSPARVKERAEQYIITQDQISAIFEYIHDAMRKAADVRPHRELAEMLKDLPKAPTVAGLRKIATERQEYSKARHVRNCIGCGNLIARTYAELCPVCFKCSGVVNHEQA